MVAKKQREKLNCKHCGKEFFFHHCELHIRKYCSQRCHYDDRPKGKDHFNWRGGRQRHSGGYIMLAPDRKLEHRVMMEEKLGRKLSSGEIVHHINGDRTDNRIENLEIMTRAQHCHHHHIGMPKPKKRIHNDLSP